MLSLWDITVSVKSIRMMKTLRRLKILKGRSLSLLLHALWLPAEGLIISYRWVYPPKAESSRRRVLPVLRSPVSPGVGGHPLISAIWFILVISLSLYLPIFFSLSFPFSLSAYLGVSVFPYFFISSSPFHRVTPSPRPFFSLRFEQSIRFRRFSPNC
jgi:hypothetical protein